MNYTTKRGYHWVARYFYRSEGGELLCFDSRPLNEEETQVAKTHIHTHNFERVEIWNRRLVDAPIFYTGKQLKSKARMVIFPSQRPEPAAVELRLVVAA